MSIMDLAISLTVATPPGIRYGVFAEMISIDTSDGCTACDPTVSVELTT
nr:hypothetical protein [uncultured Rhodopila sp.]